MAKLNDQVSASRSATAMSQPYHLYVQVMRRIGHHRWFALLMKHGGSRADCAMIQASRGRLSMSGPQLPTMLLTTTGRRSGKDRTVPLHYVRDANNVIASCENFGLDATSSWPLNLRAHPGARIEIGGTTAQYVGRPATDDEVARNMPRLIEMWPAHDTYLKRSDTRHVFVFEPADGET
jgi:deazaflavin-dependent oxidoreductase (nitroreductase family)